MSTNTNNQPTVRTEAEAEALVRRIAEANPGAVRRDLDALWEVGEADYETALSGYLWDAVEDEVPEMDEDTLDLLADAVYAYYEDQMADTDESEEGYYEEAEDAGYDLDLLAEVAVEIAHSYWDECGCASSEYERDQLEAKHDRWTDIAGDLYGGKMPHLSEEEQDQLAEWAVAYQQEYEACED